MAETNFACTGKQKITVFEGTLSSDATDINWTRLSSFDIPRSQHATIYLNGMFLLVGGAVGQGNFTNTCERYNFSKGKWSKGPKLPYPFELVHAKKDSFGKFALIFGWTQYKDGAVKALLFDEENGFKEFVSFTI